MSSKKVEDETMIVFLAQQTTAKILIHPRGFESEAEKENAQRIFPFGTAVVNPLEDALYFLGSNQEFVLLSSEPFSKSSEDRQLFGTYRNEAGIIEFHAESVARTGAVLSLDGWVIRSGDGYQLHALQAMSYGGYQQVELVTQALREKKPSEMQSMDWQAVRQKVRSPSNEARTTLSDARTIFKGIPLLTRFDVQLAGAVDGRPFGPVSGQLLVGPREAADAGRISLLVASAGFDRPGSLIVKTSTVDGTDSKDHNTRLLGSMEIGDGRVVFRVGGAGDGEAATWRAENANEVERQDSVLARITQGILELTFGDGTVSGRVDLNGLRQPTLQTSSVYQAQITGSIEQSRIVTAARRTTGISGFDGIWQTDVPRIGRLNIQEQGNTISGKNDSGSVFVKGIQNGPWASLNWELINGESGAGFLRVIPGGRELVGLLLLSPNDAGPEPVVLTRVAIAAPDLREVTKVDLRAARLLAFDLEIAGKCQQAIDTLAPILEAYKNSRGPGTEFTRPDLEAEFYIDQSFALQPLIDCAFKVGDYRKLVEYLAEAVRVQQELGPQRDVQRQFRFQAQERAQEAKKWEETLGPAQEAVGLELRRFDLGGIGITFNIVPSGSVVVTAMQRGRPAAKAGLLAGDRIVTVDDADISGRDQQAISLKLGGPAGTRVKLTIERGGERLSFDIVRESFNKFTSDRHDKIFIALEGVYENFKELERAQLSLADLSSTALAASKADDLSRLGDSFRTRSDKLLVMRNKTIETMQLLWVGHGEIGRLLKNIFDFLENAGKQKLSQGQSFREVEEDEKKLLNYVDSAEKLEPAERTLLKAQYFTQGVLNAAAYELLMAAQLIEKLNFPERFSARQSSTVEAAQTLSGWLEGWRGRLATDQAKIDALAESQDFYQQAVGLYIDVGSPKEISLAMSEAARARAFLDLLAGRPASGLEHVPGPGAASVIASPASAEPPSGADLLATVREAASTVVEYMVMPERLIVWVAVPNEPVAVRSVPTRKEELERQVSALLALIASPPRLDEGFVQKQRALLRALYGSLIVPIEDLLPALSDQPVTIVPHGELFRVPFAALLDDKGSYLIEKHPIVYAISIAVTRSVLENQRRLGGQEPADLLAFVNPTPLVRPNGEPWLGVQPLAATEENIGLITKFYNGSRGSTVLSGPEASVEAFRSEGGRYGVIYLATHAEAARNRSLDDSRVLDETFIGLAGKSLTVPDLLGSGFQLRANLIILGACETAGGTASADGINGLGRGFTYAGAASLLTTLWPVAESVTFQQVVDFHRHWREEKMSKAKALQLAQIESLGMYPFQVEMWAPLVLFGAWR